MQNAVKIHLVLKHFGCYAHTLNLVLEKSLEVAVVKSTINVVKEALKLLKNYLNIK